MICTVVIPVAGGEGQNDILTPPESISEGRVPHFAFKINTPRLANYHFLTICATAIW